MVNTYGSIGSRTEGKAQKKLLTRAQFLLCLERWGVMDPLGKGQTKTVKWRRINSLARASAPLAEAVPPEGKRVTTTDVQATLEQYGDRVSISDVIADTHEDPILNEMMDICGEQAAETIEEVRYFILRAGTNVFYANGVASRATVNSPATRGDFRKIYRFFKKHGAKEIGRIISANQNVATEPVEAAYFVYGHTDCDADIRALPGFIDSAHYSDAMKRLPGEIGKLDQFRFVLSAMASPWLAAGTSGTTYLANGITPATSTAADVYPLLVFAENAYGLVPLKGFDRVRVYVVNPSDVSHSNPLGQEGFVSWKTYQTAAILNQMWLARLEVAVTANPN